MARQVNPSDVVSTPAVRGALGISPALTPKQQQQHYHPSTSNVRAALGQTATATASKNKSVRSMSDDSEDDEDDDNDADDDSEDEIEGESRQQVEKGMGGKKRGMRRMKWMGMMGRKREKTVMRRIWKKGDCVEEGKNNYVPRLVGDGCSCQCLSKNLFLTYNKVMGALQSKLLRN